jgi:hypothetical protein
MFLTLSIHNRINICIASNIAVLLENNYLFHWSVNISPETATAVLLLEIAEKERGGNPVLFDLE